MTFIQTCQLMLFNTVHILYCEKYGKEVRVFCGQNAESWMLRMAAYMYGSNNCASVRCCDDVTWSGLRSRNGAVGSDAAETSDGVLINFTCNHSSALQLIL